MNNDLFTNEDFIIGFNTCLLMECIFSMSMLNVVLQGFYPMFYFAFHIGYRFITLLSKYNSVLSSTSTYYGKD